MNTSNTTSYSPDVNSVYDSPNLTGSPERRLLLAILERAILDFVGNDVREIQGSSDWLFSDEEESDGVGEFSFGWVCEQLDLDANTIAKHIHAMPKRGNHRIAPWYLTKNYANKEIPEAKSPAVKSNEKRFSNSPDVEERFRKAS